MVSFAARYITTDLDKVIEAQDSIVSEVINRLQPLDNVKG